MANKESTGTENFALRNEEIRMNEQFVKRVYDTVVNEHINIYKDLFENIKKQDNTVYYWKQAIEF